MTKFSELLNNNILKACFVKFADSVKVSEDLEPFMKLKILENSDTNEKLLLYRCLFDSGLKSVYKISKARRDKIQKIIRGSGLF